MSENPYAAPTILVTETPSHSEAARMGTLLSMGLAIALLVEELLPDQP